MDDIESNLGISRRTLIKRGALVGGTLIWAAPAVQTLSRAGASTTVGSPACDAKCVTVVCVCKHPKGAPKGVKVPVSCNETICDPTTASLECICGCRAGTAGPECGCPTPTCVPDEATCSSFACGPGTVTLCDQLPSCPA